MVFFYLTQFFQRVTLLLKRLRLWERNLVLFSYLRYGHRVSFLTNPKTYPFIKESLGNKLSRLTNQSQIILYSSTTFWLFSQSNAQIYDHEKSIPSS